MPTVEKKIATNAAAYDLYLSGLLKSLGLGPQAYQDAGRCFESATTIDPNFALAHAARAYMDILAAGTYVPYKEIAPRVRTLTAKALQLDPNCPDAHMVQGATFHQVDLDFPKAEIEFRKAIDLDPSNLQARLWYSVLLSVQQRYDEAKEQVREALRINPKLEISWACLSIFHYLSGDLIAATEVAEGMRVRNPDSFQGHLMTGYCYAANGRVTDALKEADLATVPPTLGDRTGRAILYALLGKPAEAEALLKELDSRSKYAFVPEIWRADLHAVLGEKEQALELLEHDYREGDKMLWTEYQYPQFDQLRGDPRFAALLKAYNLPKVGAVRLPFFSPSAKGPKAPVAASA